MEYLLQAEEAQSAEADGAVEREKHSAPPG